MINLGSSKKGAVINSLDSYLKTKIQKKYRKRGDILSLIKKLKETKNKESKEKFLLVFSTISIIIVTGVIFSF